MRKENDMTVDELKKAYLKALKTSQRYQWEVAEKHGITRFSELFGGKSYKTEDWERTASEDEKKQAAILHDNTRKAWQAYYDAWEKEKRIVKKRGKRTI